MKSCILFLCATVPLLSTSPASEARDRYGERPPAVVSPDLSAPWVMQPHGRSVRQQQWRGQDGMDPAAADVQVQPTLPENKRQQGQRSLATIRIAGIPAPVKSETSRQIDPVYLPQQVPYDGSEEPSTVIIDTTENFLYLVQAGGTARRYGVGTGKPGFEWAGTHRITDKREWPDWRPPLEMVARELKKGRILPVHMEGGPDNPLGARAIYLGSTMYRIHGTNQPWTIGSAVSSGCIRMRNEDVIDLYERVDVGTKVVVK